MFGTSGIRGQIGDDITADLALDIAHALAVDVDRVVVGRDARDSGRALAYALYAGLLECGVDVVDVGVVSTPTIARAIAVQDADAGVAITASHNPPEDNGLKLWTPSGQAFDPAHQTTIERRIDAGDVPAAAWDEHGERISWDDATDVHRHALLEAGRRRASETNTDLEDVHVIVDVGNGTGNVTADALYELGATVETLNSFPDGRFPARPSEPTAETCTGLIDHVAARNADLGIAHDGDADRMLAVDDEGRFVSGDELLAVFGLAEATAGDRIAVPVDTSLAVVDALATIDAAVTYTRVGDVHVADATTEDDVVFGGEPSGAWIFPAETRCPDGPLAAVVLSVLAAARPLSDRTDVVPHYPIRRVTVETQRKTAVMDAVSERVQAAFDEVADIDGVRATLDDGWFLIRASGTQPLIRVTAEARDPAVADRLLSEARSIVDDVLGD
jgi:phosphoglucosamine mutase